MAQREQSPSVSGQEDDVPVGQENIMAAGEEAGMLLAALRARMQELPREAELQPGLARAVVRAAGRSAACGWQSFIRE
jgi:hypothetical protein